MTHRKKIPDLILKGRKIGAMLCIPITCELVEALEAIAGDAKISRTAYARGILESHLTSVKKILDETRPKAVE